LGGSVEVREAGAKGRGVFAARDFAPGELVLRFERGRVVRVEEVAALPAWEREHLGELTARTCQVLPAPRCYLNHACAPNALSDATAVRAWRAIRAGEEVTIDYRLNALDDWTLACACDAALGPHTVVGDFFSLAAELQERYLPYAPPFVQREYWRRCRVPWREGARRLAAPRWPTSW
jgi:hypothetical protein